MEKIRMLEIIKADKNAKRIKNADTHLEFIMNIGFNGENKNEIQDKMLELLENDKISRKNYFACLLFTNVISREFD